MPERVCPIWVGYLLASPLRKLFQNPNKILKPYVESGMTVLDIGCAMGFFSLPLARLVGPNGKVICVDLQKEMIKSLEKRALKAGLTDRIETRLCDENSLGLDDLVEKIDFALAVAVVHEVPDASKFFGEVHKSLKPEHILLVVEPRGHVSETDFEKTVLIAEENKFTIIDKRKERISRVAVLKK